MFLPIVNRKLKTSKVTSAPKEDIELAKLGNPIKIRGETGLELPVLILTRIQSLERNNIKRVRTKINNC